MKPELPCAKCPGECCGPVPLSTRRLHAIEEHLRGLEPSELRRIATQRRDALTCAFYDLQRHACGVYAVRPQVCRMFGATESLECPRQPVGWVFTIAPDSARLRADMDTTDMAMVSTEYRYGVTA